MGIKNKYIIGYIWLALILILATLPLQAQKNSLNAGMKEFRKGKISLAHDYFKAGIDLCYQPGILTSELGYWYAKTTYLLNPKLIDSSLALIEKSIGAYPENINAIYYKVILLNKKDFIQDNKLLRFNMILDILQYDQSSKNILSKNYQNASSYYVLSVVLANLNDKEGAMLNILFGRISNPL